MRAPPLRILAVIPAVLVALSTAPAVTLAAGPERSSVQIRFDEPSVFGSCDGYDLIATDVLIDRQTLTWFDDNGEPIREQRQVHFYFTLTNSVSGTQAEYIGHFARPADFVTGEEALLGAYRQIFIDNRNTWRAAGRDAIVSDGSLVVNGQQTLAEWEEGLCAAMA